MINKLIIRYIFFIPCAIFLGLSAVGCKKSSNKTQPEKQFIVQIKDVFGHETKLKQYPKRIVSMAPSNTEILLHLGVKDRLVGVTSFYGYPEKVRGIEKIGGYINPNFEKIVSLKPDLVFAARGNPKQLIFKLRKYRINVFTLDTHNLSDLFYDIKNIGELVGVEEKANRLVQYMKDEIAEVKNRLKNLRVKQKPRVFWLGQEEPLLTAGTDNIINELIRLAGGINIAEDSNEKWPRYSREKLLLKNPDIIIVSDDKYKSSDRKLKETIQRFKNDPVWQNIAAVNNERIYFVPTDLIGQPSPRNIEGLNRLVRSFHPELFESKN